MSDIKGTPGSNSKGFFTELRRRRVLQVSGAYIAIAWLVTEIAGFFLEQAGAPPWSLRLLAIVFMVGFPIAVILSWVIQVQPDGKRILDSSKGQHRTVIGAITLGVIATAGLAWLILPRIEDAPALPGYDPLPHSIAILPFIDPDATPNEITIGETLYTALTDGLNASRELTQVQLKLDEQPGDLVAFGRSVRVVNLLAGRLLRSAGSTRVEMTLLDVESGKPHWTRLFEWDPTQVMDLGTELANGVLGSMNLPLMSTNRFAGTNNRDAYKALLLGRRTALTKFHGEDFRRAIPHTQKAIDLDPDYLLAHVSLVNFIEFYLQFVGAQGEELQQLRNRQKQALETAQRLDSNSPLVISLLGRLVMQEDPEMAIQLFRRALDLDPNNGTTLVRYAYVIRGRDAEKSKQLWRRLVDLYPMDANNHNELAKTLRMMGRLDEARTEIQKSIELDPEMAQNYWKLSKWEVEDTGRVDKALLLSRRAHTYDPGGSVSLGNVILWYAALGAREEARVWTGKAIESHPGSWFTWFYAAWAHLVLGEVDLAIEYADRGAELKQNVSWVMLYQLLRDVRSGQTEQALRRYQEVHPQLTKLDDLVIDGASFESAVMYSWLLVESGDEVLAGQLLERSIALLNEICSGKGTGAQIKQLCNLKWAVHSLLNQRQETLAELRRMIIEDHIRLDFGMNRFDKSPYGTLDFLKDDPEFQHLMKIVNDDLAVQLERVREMERNSEIPPPPWEADSPHHF